MNSSARNTVAMTSSAQAALMHLCRPFVSDDFAAECDLVDETDVPPPNDALLVHRNHMTVELQRHHGQPVRERVHQEYVDGDVYTRKITLALAGSDRIVECGIVRLHLHFLPGKVREQVLAKERPLGAILIDHQVHRRIEPRFYVRFAPECTVLALFEIGDLPAEVYGRLGTIYCNNQPAIELLEIVVNA